MARPAKGYRLKDNTRVCGVTTILARFKESGGLIHWAWQCGIDGKDYRTTRDDAASAGHYAHGLIEESITGVPYDRPQVDADMLMKAETAFRAFTEWRTQSKVNIIVTETPMVSEKLHFGGTLDAVGMVNGRLALLDWKSSNAIYAENIIQAAAYSMLWAEHHPGGEQIEGVHLLRVGKEFGDFHHHYWPRDIINVASEAFIHMLRLYELDKTLKQAVR